MGSKIFLVLGLLVAMVLLISMEVAAGDLAETSTNRKQNADEATETNGVDDSKEPYGTPPGGAYGSPPRGGYSGSYCRYGCCGGGYYGRVCRCCSYAGEAVEANTKAKRHN